MASAGVVNEGGAWVVCACMGVDVILIFFAKYGSERVTARAVYVFMCVNAWCACASVSCYFVMGCKYVLYARFPLIL